MNTYKINKRGSWSFHDLMLHRIHEILLVSSPYDGYILEEDGRLTEQILTEYVGMHLNYAPRVWRASSATDAMERLSRRKIDLVITMLRIYDMDPITFGEKVKKSYPHIPVILLAYDTAELKHLPEQISTNSVDKIFIWNGDATVFTAIMKYIEDKKNIKRDIRIADIRSVIVVEDNPQYYSIILPMIYSEIIYHTHQLMDDSVDDTHRILRLRARPKILLATNYEEAEKYFKRFHNNLFGVISDIRFPRNGKLDKNAGYELIKWMRTIDPSIPILLQSTDEQIVEKAREVNALFLNKKSKTLLQDLREFIVNNFGFGDFIFRLPNGKAVARATDLKELRDGLKKIPEESVKFHASRNHFSNWLAARSEFWLASKLRPMRMSDYEQIESIRQILVDSIDKARHAKRVGRVIDSFKKGFDPEATLSRVRGGSLGGKARGLAFASSILAKSDLAEKFPDIVIKIPNSVVIGTSEFDEFMIRNNLWDFALQEDNNDEIRNKFLSGSLSFKLINFLQKYLQEVTSPIAIRSSGLLEDSRYQSLAGMYSTYMLSNSSDDFSLRLKNVCDAVKLVYASTFYQEPKSVIKPSPHRQEAEKMAVIIQEVVGQEYNRKFYPNISGVAKNINYYPISYLKREEGIAYVVLGLGRMVVEGGKALRFSPYYPLILPQFYSPRAILKNSQFQFYAMKLDNNELIEKISEDSNLSLFDLSVAEKDGTLRYVGSTLSEQDNIVRDSLSYKGTRIISFASILKWKAFPLADVLAELLELGEQAFGCPIELEFAVNLSSDHHKKSEFNLLQIRPMALDHFSRYIDVDHVAEDEIFCRSELSLGDGVYEDIQDIIFVKLDNLDMAKSREIAKDIADFNSQFGKNSRYILIGPGRWGSADPWLGIPVFWNNISHAQVIVEVGLEDLQIDPSFGSHFFQNVTSLRIGYFTINHKGEVDLVDWDWLNSQKVHKETRFLKWIKLDIPVTINIDGRTGYGIAVKPQRIKPEVMDEEESTGI